MSAIQHCSVGQSAHWMLLNTARNPDFSEHSVNIQWIFRKVSVDWKENFHPVIICALRDFVLNHLDCYTLKKNFVSYQSLPTFLYIEKSYIGSTCLHPLCGWKYSEMIPFWMMHVFFYNCNQFNRIYLWISKLKELNRIKNKFSGNGNKSILLINYHKKSWHLFLFWVLHNLVFKSNISFQ